MTDNKSRKRKWDDQGTNEHETTTPPNPSDALAAAAAVAAKLQSANSNLASSTPLKPSTDATKGSNSIQQQVNEQLAKITANLQAKGINIQNHPQPTTTTNTTTSSTTASPTVTSDPYNLNKESSSNKGKFCKNIEINDVKNKYMLTKASLLDKLQEETKAEIITRGKYYSNKALATAKDPPLYLHVAAETQEILDNAVKKIQEIIDSKPPVIVHTDTTTSAYHKPAGQPSKRFHTAKIFIGIDDRTFNTKTKLIGIQGANVKHINRETGARLQLRGKGSGFIEQTSGTEAFEPMFFHISSLTEEGLEKAKQLVEDLIKTVKAEYEKFKQYKANRPNNPRPHYNSYNQNPYGNAYQQPNMTTSYQVPGYTYPGYTYPPPPLPSGTESTYPAAPGLPNAPAPPLPTTSSETTTAQTTDATTATTAASATTQTYYQTTPTVATPQSQYSNYYMYNSYYYYQPPLPSGAPPLPSTTPPLPPTTTTTESAAPPPPSAPYQPSSPTK